VLQQAYLTPPPTPPAGDSSISGPLLPLTAVAMPAAPSPACCASRLDALLPPKASRFATRATGPSSKPALQDTKHAQESRHQQKSANFDAKGMLSSRLHDTSMSQ
jgi:hypothetical protein